MSGNGERKKDNFGEDIIDEEEKSLDEAKDLVEYASTLIESQYYDDAI